MRRGCVSCAWLVVVWAAGAALGQGAPADGVPAAAPLERDPVARLMKPVLEARLELFLELLNGRPERSDELVYTEEFLRTMTPEEVLRRIAAASESSGGFEVLERRQIERTVIGAWLRSKDERRAKWILKVGVESGLARRTERFELYSAPSPGEGAASAWDEFGAALEEAGLAHAFGAYRIGADGAMTPVFEAVAGRRMAVGEIGTLWAHLALCEATAEGRVSWEQAQVVDESLRSLPPTRTSRLEGGATLPLLEFARRAQFSNDATAAEHVIALVGRERIERTRDAARAASGEAGAAGGEPFLTPNEMLKLKLGATDLITRYAEASNEARRRLLETEVLSADVHGMLYRVWRAPQELDRVGWTASPRELCFAAARLREMSLVEGQSGCLAALRPERSLTPGGGWATTAGRSGGGEPGVFAAVNVFERPDGQAFVMALILNDAERLLPRDVPKDLVRRASAALAQTP